MPGAMKPQESDWTFNFRTSSRILDDSDSDSESEDTVADRSEPSAKGCLSDGIDLSSREEAVVYKPNPFSIAKINAANRARNQKRPAHVQGRQNFSAGPPRPTSKLVSKPVQANILDSFKIQAHKAGLRANLAQGSKPAVPGSPVKRSQAEHALNSPVLTQNPLYLIPKVVSVPIQDCVSSIILEPQHMEGHSMMSSNSVHQDNAHILARDNSPIPISIHDNNPKNNLQNNALPATVPESQNFVPLNSSAQFASRFAQNFTPRAYRKSAFPMSSPLRGRASTPTSNFKDTRFSSPIAAGPRRDIPSPNINQHRITPFKPCFPSTSCISSVRVASNLTTVATIKTEEMPEHRPPPNAYHQIKTEQAPSTPTHEFLKETAVNPPSSFVHQHAVQSKTPIPVVGSFTRSHKKTSLRDAYAFGASDPDEDWSTLPSRKKKKPNPEKFGMPPVLTKPFTLPGLLPVDAQQMKHSQSRRKVHLYIPPPLVPTRSYIHQGNGEDQNSPLQEASGTGSPTHPSYAETKSSTDANVYPSPSRSRVSKPCLPQMLTVKKECIGIRHTPESRPTHVYRPPSPPTSDLPMPDEDTDIHIHVDPQDVRRKHPATNALFEKV